jgi:hypothetical protein
MSCGTLAGGNDSWLAYLPQYTQTDITLSRPVFNHLHVLWIVLLFMIRYADAHHIWRLLELHACRISGFTAERATNDGVQNSLGVSSGGWRKSMILICYWRIAFYVDLLLMSAHSYGKGPVLLFGGAGIKMGYHAGDL